MTEREANLRIGELARRTGVSVPTIHFYLREGLLPPAPRKTHRNMAYYDESYVTRLRLIRRLQDERGLPLRVIRSLLVEADRGGDEMLDLVEIQARVLPSVELRGDAPEVDREELLQRTGVHPDDLEALETIALVTPRRVGRRARYSGEDVVLAGAVARLRSLGLTREIFPASDLALYQRAVSQLVGDEARLLTRRIRDEEVPPAGALEAAIHTLGEVIVHLRRKLIRDLTDGLRSDVSGGDRSRRPRSRRRER